MKRAAAQVRAIAKVFFGSAAARHELHLGRFQRDHSEKGVRTLFSTEDAEDPGLSETPIFILSAGWRSGSTLLQRLICSSQDVLIWGEPYDRSNLVQTLTQTVAPFSEDWPPEGYIKPSQDLNALKDQWAANLYPPQPALRSAYRALLLNLFAKPAYELGAARWGFKEVRLGYAEAVFLKSLFPNARFLFIRRQLPDAYLSYKGFSGGMSWFANWPETTAFTPFSFARHWARLSRDVERAALDTGGILVEYEDLIAGKTDLNQLSDYCGISVDGSTLNTRIGSGNKTHTPQSLLPLERVLLWSGLTFERLANPCEKDH